MSSRPPFYKEDMFQIPPVPDFTGPDKSRLTRSEWAIRAVVIVVVIALLAVTSVIVYKGIYSPIAPGVTPAPTQPLSRPNCPTLTVDQSPPSLAFCSPQFRGYVGGPVGSHIVLDGINLSPIPTLWVIAKKSKTVDTMSIFNKCLSNKPGDACSPLPPPQSLPQQTASVSLFAWTWNPPQFPSTTGDYNIITEIGDAANPQIIPSSLAFSVLVSNPACISINVDPVKKPAACSGQQFLALNVHANVTIYGANWLLGWAAISAAANEDIVVDASCVPLENSVTHL